MLFYVMSNYVMLCCVMSCYVMFVCMHGWMDGRMDGCVKSKDVVSLMQAVGSHFSDGLRCHCSRALMSPDVMDTRCVTGILCVMYIRMHVC